MRLYCSIIVVFFLKISIVNAQVPKENQVKPDTIKETIIYEYDTVYLAPDTLKLTDTIINYLPDKKKLRTHNWSIGLKFLPFISNAFNGKNVIDSFSLQQKLNYCIDLNLRYTKEDIVYGMDVGITPLHEQIQYQNLYQISLPKNVTSYDSLQIDNNCTSNNYFNYLNANLSIGKKWGKMNFYYAINASFLTVILIDYKAFLPIKNPDNKMPSSMVKKLGFGAALNPIIGYRIGKNWDCYLSLLYRYTLDKKNKYPQSNLHYMDIGFGAGLNFIL